MPGDSSPGPVLTGSKSGAGSSSSGSRMGQLRVTRGALVATEDSTRNGPKYTAAAPERAMAWQALESGQLARKTLGEAGAPNVAMLTAAMTGGNPTGMGRQARGSAI